MFRQLLIPIKQLNNLASIALSVMISPNTDLG